jgi:cytochrome P450
VTTVDTPSQPLFNPFDPAFRADPYPFYDALRAAEPVHVSPFGFVVLSRYDDIARTLRSNEFSRDIEANADEPESEVAKHKRERRAQRAKSILNLDPPDHTRLRRLVSKAFTPTAIERLRPRVQQLVDDVLDRAAERGEIELVDELAFPVPFQVISDLLAMPTDRADDLRSWSQVLTFALEPIATDDDLDRVDEVFAEFIPYLAEIIEHRRRHLGDDVLSALLLAEEEGDRLTDQELMAFVVLLYVAGHETTVNLIGNGTLALLRHRDQLARWRDDPAMGRGGAGASPVDELLRFDGPVQLTVRAAIQQVRYDDVVVEPGTVVMTVLGAANHDASVFADPHALQLDRANANKHLAFSAGIHYCLGASLAKLEAEVAIGSLIRRFPNIEVTGGPEWRDRITIRGVSRLDLSVR